MPIYEYECTKCGRIEEKWQKFSDKPATSCGHCSGKLRKIMSQSTFHLKGTGWYVTDYANKSGSASSGAKEQRELSTPASSKTESSDSVKKTKSSTKKDS